MEYDAFIIEPQIIVQAFGEQYIESITTLIISMFLNEYHWLDPWVYSLYKHTIFDNDILNMLVFIISFSMFTRTQSTCFTENDRENIIINFLA